MRQLRPFGPLESWRPAQVPDVFNGLRRVLPNARLRHAAEEAAPGRVEGNVALAESLTAEEYMLLWVESDMVELAADALAEMPEVTLAEVPWPAPHGFVALGLPVALGGFDDTELNTPDGVADVRGFAWTIRGDTIAIVMLDEVDTYVQRVAVNAGRAGDDPEAIAAVEDFAAQVGGEPRIVPLGVCVFPLSRPISDADDSEDRDYPFTGPARFLAALGMLMAHDGIATISTRAAAPPARRGKSKGSARRAAAKVRIVEIRTGTSASSAYSGTSREYRHRWVVRGHWRRLPAREDGTPARLTYIAPYVKGPKDAPLLGGPKVHTFRGR